MEIKVLGPVEACVDGQTVAFESAKVRHLAAILALAPGRSATPDVLIDRIWGDTPPAKARDNLHAYVNRLRRAAQKAGSEIPLRFRAGTYTWGVSDTDIDVHRFRAIVARARTARTDADHAAARADYVRAEALWRGDALGGLDGAWAERMRRALHHERRTALLERVDSDLILGRTDVVSDLLGLLADEPFDQKAVGALMLALYRCGRQTDALDAFHRLRLRLRQEMGDDPDADLRRLHQQILRHDPALRATAPSAVSVPAARPAPPVGLHGLPRDIHPFVGRSRETARLSGLLTPDGDGAHQAVPVIVVDGMAGVGKTALAVHVAHRMAGQYPDAQLFIDLHGYSSASPPLDPSTALAMLLATLGTPSGGIPPSLEARAATWRALLAERRILLVCDNAAGTDQVRPLLPGTPNSAVIVTSRSRLVDFDNVRTLSLDVLPPTEAGALLLQVIDDAVRCDTEDIAWAVRRCGGLPLFLHLTGSRLRHRPAWSVTEAAQWLTTSDDGVRPTFDLSYAALPADQRDAFRALGLHPTPHVTAGAAAALLGRSGAAAQRLIDGLIDHHLVEEPSRGVYHFHDLLHDYARTLATEDDHGALARLFAYQLHGLDAADRLLFAAVGRRLPPGMTDLPADLRPELADAEAAERWMGAEFSALLATVADAAASGHPAQVGWLARLLGPYFDARAHWEAGVTTQAAAAEAWHRLDDPAGEAEALTALGRLHGRTARYAAAKSVFERAIAIYRRLGDIRGEADALDELGLVQWHQSDNITAMRSYQQALELFRSLGDRGRQAHVFSHLGIACYHLSRLDQASDYYRRGLALAQDANDQAAQAAILLNMGHVDEVRGHLDDALGRFQRASAAALEMHRTQWHAAALSSIGRIEHRLHRYEDARVHHEEALAVFRAIGDTRCEADTLNCLGTLSSDRTEWDRARDLHQEALTIATAIADPQQCVRAHQGLGRVHLRTGEHPQALAAFDTALAGAREISSGYDEAHALDGLAQTLAATGDPVGATQFWRDALRIFDRLGAPEAAGIRERLSAYPTTRPPDGTGGRGTDSPGKAPDTKPGTGP